ncbi:uncharacterized protein LOC130904419 [Corythoichthys intestinalis]|uniref:uncharacterized protein LOC130904419 n=1 Tax=Corythoichthys intestinalis TaxID=161448 RepID=UPI0025A64E48|nr:uncharacterized protein LOC130904419 [Corythoichthys intestinalis]
MQLAEKQSLDLSCPVQQDNSGLMSVHLYHRRGDSQTTLLSLDQGVDGELRLDPDYKRRLQLSGVRSASGVKVTLLHLQPGDSGLYVCEKRDNGSRQIILTQEVLLLVEAPVRPCQCSSSYSPLPMTIFSAAGLILIVLLWLAIQECVKVRRSPPAGPAAVQVYEEMTRKQQNASVPRNRQETLEEVTSPLYANTPVRQTQDNYYACPRQITLRA